MNFHFFYPYDTMKHITLFYVPLDFNKPSNYYTKQSVHTFTALPINSVRYTFHVSLNIKYTIRTGEVTYSRSEVTNCNVAGTRRYL